MTIFYPDLSHWDRERGVRLEAGTVAVVAKVTQARSIADPAYVSWKADAARVGAIFGAYHWLNHGNAAAQAAWCHAHAGRTPLMIDAEDVSGNTGFNGPLTVKDILDFTNAYRALGGVVTLVYLPRWYWAGNMGSPDLRPLTAAGLALVSSNYRAYSDTGAGWTAYGGISPAVWQYTNAHGYGGSSCDFNAFRGTAQQFAALLGGGGPIPTSEGDGDLDTTQAKQLADVYYTLTTNDQGLGAEHVRWATAMPLLEAIAKKVEIDAGELEAIKAAAREGAMSAAEGLVAAVLAALPEGDRLTRSDVEQAVRDAFAGGLAARNA